MLQHPRHGQLQEVVVPQVKPGQVDPGEHAWGQALQQVGVEEQQLEGRHGVEGARIHFADLVILEIQIPYEGRRGRIKKKGIKELQPFCSGAEGSESNSLRLFPSMRVAQYAPNVTRYAPWEAHSHRQQRLTRG